MFASKSTMLLGCCALPRVLFFFRKCRVSILGQDASHLADAGCFFTINKIVHDSNDHALVRFCGEFFQRSDCRAVIIALHSNHFYTSFCSCSAFILHRFTHRVKNQHARLRLTTTSGHVLCPTLSDGSCRNPAPERSSVSRPVRSRRRRRGSRDCGAARPCPCRG